MNRIKRALIMAAGKGERLRPVTDHTPKPLVSVNGVRMIDSVIAGLHANGISEIYVVVGYMKEQFVPLEKEYPGVKLINNPDYETWNNVSSLYAARDHLEDCIILDGDQIIADPGVLAPEFERSGYNAVWTDEPTAEWLLQTENGIIKSCSRTGGTHGWQLYSISRWTAEDGKTLKRHLEQVYRDGIKDIYWDDIPVFIHPEEYTLGIREMKKEDVLEIDTFDELVSADPSYSEMTKPWRTTE